jgi:hypothetical protein
MPDVTATEGLLRMLAVFLALCALTAAIFGLVRLFAPHYARVTPKTLSRSVIRATGGGKPLENQPLRCHRLGRGWSCPVPEEEGSGSQATYKVTMKDAHCWDATKTIKEAQNKLPTKASDCVLDEDRHD